MAGGLLGVLLASLVFGAAGAAWNRTGMNLRSNIRLILFASGFFAAGIVDAKLSFVCARNPSYTCAVSAGAPERGEVECTARVVGSRRA